MSGIPSEPARDPRQAGAAREHRLGRGAFCISIDIELGWGYWDVPSAAYLKECLRQERAIVRRMLELFRQYEISATWAIVGSLLDPEASAAEDHKEAWFAPDLIDAMRAAAPVQEIGSHSYRHPYFTSIAADEAAADLGAARAVHARHGLDFTSFVFPRNRVAHLPLLAANGIRVFRGRDRGVLVRTGQRMRGWGERVANFADKMLPLPAPVVHPLIHAEGLVEVPGSMLLMARNGLRQLIHPRVVEARATSALKRASLRGGVFHLWFHPSNFYFRTAVQFATLERILTAAAAFRNTGHLEIVTMKNFANLVDT